MAQYVVTILSKKPHGWAYEQSEEVELSAQANILRFEKDLKMYCDDFYGMEKPTDSQIEKWIREIAQKIDDRFERNDIENMINSTIREVLDDNEVYIEGIEADEFVETNIEVDEGMLERLITYNLIEDDIKYNNIVNTMGVHVFAVRKDDELIGKVITNWLEG